MERDDEHIVDPPIVDHLYVEPQNHRFVVTFIPEDVVSKECKEIVEIDPGSDDGRRVTLWLDQLGKLLGFAGPVQKLFHSGGGDFGFYGPGGAEASLSDSKLGPAVSQQAYVALQDLGQTAQVAFLLARRPPAGHPKTLHPRILPVELADGRVLRGTAEGNNASWLCVCGYRLPLIGTTRTGAGDTRCPNCGRLYRVLPFPHDGSQVTSVREIELAKATA